MCVYTYLNLNHNLNHMMSVTSTRLNEPNNNICTNCSDVRELTHMQRQQWMMTYMLP